MAWKQLGPGMWVDADDLNSEPVFSATMPGYPVPVSSSVPHIKDSRPDFTSHPPRAQDVKPDVALHSTEGLMSPCTEDTDLKDAPALDPLHPLVYIDYRELKSPVTKELERLGCNIQIRTLDVADYVISDRVGYERKSSDFFSTLFDRREFFSQIRDLCHAYRRPALIMEGGIKNIYGSGARVESIRGVFNTLHLTFGIPVLYTENAFETAAVISGAAAREQNAVPKRFNPHSGRTHMTLAQKQHYVISSICDVGPTIAENLLNKHGSVRAVISAGRDDLMTVDKVGAKIADGMLEILTTPYTAQPLPEKRMPFKTGKMPGSDAPVEYMG